MPLFPAHTYLELILSPTLSQGQYTGAPCTDPSHKSCSQATLNTGSRFLHMVMFNYKTTQCHTDLLLMSISHWLMALIGAPNSTLFPHAERMVPPPRLFYGRTPCQMFFPPWVRTAFYHFPPSFTSIVSFTTISTDVLFLLFPSLYYLPIYSPFLHFTPFSLYPFMSSLYYSDTSV